jgi:hypothetical protein
VEPGIDPVFGYNGEKEGNEGDTCGGGGRTFPFLFVHLKQKAGVEYLEFDCSVVSVKQSKSKEPRLRNVINFGGLFRTFWLCL